MKLARDCRNRFAPAPVLGPGPVRVWATALLSLGMADCLNPDEPDSAPLACDPEPALVQLGTGSLPCIEGAVRTRRVVHYGPISLVSTDSDVVRLRTGAATEASVDDYAERIELPHEEPCGIRTQSEVSYFCRQAGRSTIIVEGHPLVEAASIEVQAPVTARIRLRRADTPMYPARYWPTDQIVVPVDVDPLTLNAPNPTVMMGTLLYSQLDAVLSSGEDEYEGCVSFDPADMGVIGTVEDRWGNEFDADALDPTPDLRCADSFSGRPYQARELLLAAGPGVTTVSSSTGTALELRVVTPDEATELHFCISRDIVTSSHPCAQDWSCEWDCDPAEIRLGPPWWEMTRVGLVYVSAPGVDRVIGLGATLPTVRVVSGDIVQPPGTTVAYLDHGRVSLAAGNRFPILPGEILRVQWGGFVTEIPIFAAEE